MRLIESITRFFPSSLAAHRGISSHPDQSSRRLVMLGAVPIVAFAVLSAVATYEAYRLRYPRALGDPLFDLSLSAAIASALLLAFLAFQLRHLRFFALVLALTGATILLSAFVPIYSGFSTLAWLAIFAGSPFTKTLIFHILLAFALTGLIALAFSRLGDRAHEVYGSSRFGGIADLRRAGFLSDSGLFLGRKGRHVVRYSGGEHVLAVMPTGAGKTSCFLIPTVLSMTDHSVVISDVKGAEIFQATAGARALTHDVFRFEPAATSLETDTARWNPLDEVPRGDGDVAALQRQAADLIVPSKHGHETHWHRAARELFVLLALEAIYHPDLLATIGSVRRLLVGAAASPDEESKETSPRLRALFERCAKSVHDPNFERNWVDPSTGKPVSRHPEVTNLAQRFAATEARELSSIVSTLAAFLQPWADERVNEATAGSDFSLADLAPDSPRQRPAALYIVVPRHDLARLAPLLRLFYSSLASLLSSSDRFVDWSARAGKRKRRTYIFLDEAPMLGYMPVFGDMLATLRGYGATLMIVAQDLAQIRNIYGNEEPITGGCPIFLTAGSQRPETLRHISALAGESTVVWERTTRSISAGGFFGRRSRSRSMAEARRPLLTTGEVRTLAPDRALLFAPGLHPISLTKAPYFRDHALRARAAIRPPSEASPHDHATDTSRPAQPLRNPPNRPA